MLWATAQKDIYAKAYEFAERWETHSHVKSNIPEGSYRAFCESGCTRAHDIIANRPQVQNYTDSPDHVADTFAGYPLKYVCNVLGGVTPIPPGTLQRPCWIQVSRNCFWGKLLHLCQVWAWVCSILALQDSSSAVWDLGQDPRRLRRHDQGSDGLPPVRVRKGLVPPQRRSYYNLARDKLAPPRQIRLS